MIIPFFIVHAGCPHQCVFCDQKRITGEPARPDTVSVAATIRRYRATGPSDASAEVAFFGGTFTALPLDEQRAYLEQVHPFIVDGTVRSIRISTRPDAVTAPGLALLTEYGVATVELGVQSLHDEVLRSSARGHTAEDAVRAAALLQKSGFRVGFQLMPGLPGDSADRFRQTVERTISLRPDLVRLYPALVIRDTPLAARYGAGGYTPLSLEEAVTWCSHALEAFAQARIPVIRVGLQPTEELERPGSVVAGPYHPAFRELVESARFLVKMRQEMPAGQDPAFLVHPLDLGAAIGHGKRNLAALRKEFGHRTTVQANASVPRGTVAVKRSCARDDDTL